jgi:hypothetical protein
MTFVFVLQIASLLLRFLRSSTRTPVEDWTGSKLLTYHRIWIHTRIGKFSCSFLLKPVSQGSCGIVCPLG